MRCPICGFNNIQITNKCIKCNFNISQTKNENNIKENDINKIDSSEIKNDMIKLQINSLKINTMVCENCNYPNINEAEICINCSAVLKSKNEFLINQSNSLNNPINPEILNNGFNVAKKYISVMSPLNHSENPNYILKSSQFINTNEKDILSKIKVEKRGGKWFIENHNENAIVFTKAKKKEEIESGDIIILNDGRMLQFIIR